MFVQDEAVWVVVADDNPVFLSESDQLFVEFHAGIGSCRHIRVVGPHQLDVRKVHLFQLFEVRLPAQFLFQLVRDQIGLDQFAYRTVGRITRIGNQHAVARIQECQRDVQDSLFGTDQRLDFRFRVEIHVIPFFIPVGKTFTQFGNTDIRLITVFVRLMSMFAQCLDCPFRRRKVGTAYAEVDHVFTCGIHFGYFFQFPGKVVFLYATYTVSGCNCFTHFVFLLHIRLIFLSLLSTV